MDGALSLQCTPYHPPWLLCYFHSPGLLNSDGCWRVEPKEQGKKKKKDSALANKADKGITLIGASYPPRRPGPRGVLGGVNRPWRPLALDPVADARVLCTLFSSLLLFLHVYGRHL